MVRFFSLPGVDTLRIRGPSLFIAGGGAGKNARGARGTQNSWQFEGGGGVGVTENMPIGGEYADIELRAMSNKIWIINLSRLRRPYSMNEILPFDLGLGGGGGGFMSSAFITRVKSFLFGL